MKKTELNLICELIKNCRRSNKELAKALRTSQLTVSRTIQRIEKAGLIREYAAIPDFKKLGYALMAITFVKTKKKLPLEAILKERKNARKHFDMARSNVVMLERGMGLGFDGVVFSVHKDFSDYMDLKRFIQESEFVDMAHVDSFLINLQDDVRYIPLTFSFLAKDLQEMDDSMLSKTFSKT